MTNENLIPKMLQYVQISSVLGKRALDELGKRQAAEKRAADQAPALLELMLSTKAIHDGQKQAVAQMLSDHAATQQLLKNAVDKIAELTKAAATHKAAGDLGQGVDENKTGSDQPEDWAMHTPFVGQRTSVKKGSDRAMFRKLGLPCD